jgi:hypothetical protein
MTAEPHSDATREKIGKSVKGSSWRRKTGDKSGEMQSAVGQWDEDYTSPSLSHIRRRGLWEESHGDFRRNR